METLLLVGLIIDNVVLLLIAATDLSRFDVSAFQLKQETKEFKTVHKSLSKIRLLQTIESILLGSIAVALGVALYGYMFGVAAALVGFVVVAALARVGFVRSYAYQLFDHSVDTILLVARVTWPLRYVIGESRQARVGRPQSLDELLDVIETLPVDVVNSTYKQRLASVLKTETKMVKDVMTGKKQALVVDPDATLGPILLSDLQKSGHGYFPVGAKKSHPEGLLDISELTDIHGAKKNKTVRDIMDTNLVWVEEETSLEELVQAFLQEKQYLMFVRNLDGDFTGIVTIADLLEHLTGIVKE
ncbi:CBS domain-containing protein [Candidatus Saccharibacteria bacterium]|nr:CBS domain-containing protein [Candidatus Saccharibacteria bacterium]MCA9328252.1 CBS domain-containing protein [Candidatus Saccharibacteria bacterium]